jgi:organic radical activating enzyme
MIKYSEIFFSPQGEGEYVGCPSVWLRFFLCNLQCDGFGQVDPTNPETYVLPYKNIDVKSIQRLEDLPVFTHGCDSSYSWSAKFKHLQHQHSADELANKIVDLLPNRSWDNFHFCITGGEPLLPANQKAIVELWSAFERHPAGIPKFVTFETNGTQVLSQEFIDFIRANQSKTEFFFSLSPKLFSVSGEKEAVIRNVIKQYSVISSFGQLKFVVNGTPTCWQELEDAIKGIKEVGVKYPVMLMPVGATKEQQENLGDLISECGRRGYRVTPRAHAHWFKNTMGV